MTHTNLASRHHGTIRNATLLDTSELCRLIGKMSASRADALDLLSHGHLLVLEVGNDALGALIHVDVAGNQATLDLLVIDLGLRGQHVAERMTSVAQALCEAYGYEVADPVVEPRRAVGARSRR